MKTPLTRLIIAIVLLASCGKKVDPPKEPDPIAVKIVNWSISNQYNQSRWNVNIDIDKALDEDVTITCVFTSFPENTKVTVPIKLPKGWISWYGVSVEKPATISSGMLSNTQSFTITGTKKYTLTY